MNKKPKYQTKTDKAGNISSVIDTTTGKELDKKQMKKFLKAVSAPKTGNKVLQIPVYDNCVKIIKVYCAKCGKKFETKVQSGVPAYKKCPKCNGLTEPIRGNV